MFIDAQIQLQSIIDMSIVAATSAGSTTLFSKGPPHVERTKVLGFVRNILNTEFFVARGLAADGSPVDLRFRDDVPPGVFPDERFISERKRVVFELLFSRDVQQNKRRRKTEASSSYVQAFVEGKLYDCDQVMRLGQVYEFFGHFDSTSFHCSRVAAVGPRLCRPLPGFDFRSGRDVTIDALRKLLPNDSERAAELMLCHLISAKSPFPLCLVNADARLRSNVWEFLSSVFSKSTTKLVSAFSESCFPLAPTFEDRSTDDDDARLVGSAPLQVPPESHVCLDLTNVRLNPTDRKALEALVESSRLTYTFAGGFHVSEIPVDTRLLVFNDDSFSAQVVDCSGGGGRSVLDLAHASAISAYLEACITVPCATLNDNALEERIANDFVLDRAADVDSANTGTLHAVLRVAKLMSNSLGQPYMTSEAYAKARAALAPSGGRGD